MMSQTFDGKTCEAEMSKIQKGQNYVPLISEPVNLPVHTHTQQPTIVVAHLGLGDTPIRTVCPNCRNEIMTRTKHEKSFFQRLACFLLCLNGCLCCSCLPYYCGSCANTRHECPNCNAHLGSHKM